MAIAVYVHPQGMTKAKYDEVHAAIDAAGGARPKGRLHHSSFGPPDALMVYDVWESQADFDEFGKILMPVLQKVGLDIGQPDIMPIHNIEQ